MNKSLVRFAFGAVIGAVSITGVALTAAPVVAQEAAPQQKFVADLGQKAIDVLQQKNRLGQSGVRQQFSVLLRQNFDIPTIGRFVLGAYWRTATPQQQQEYLRLFEDMIVAVYAQRFDDYAGEKLQVVGSSPLDARDTMVKSQIVQSDGTPVLVDWRVRSANGGFKIVDVVVENVSMSITQRADFAAVIEQGGGQIDALLANMRTRINAPASASAASVQ